MKLLTLVLSVIVLNAPVAARVHADQPAIDPPLSATLLRMEVTPGSPMPQPGQVTEILVERDGQVYATRRPVTPTAPVRLEVLATLSTETLGIFETDLAGISPLDLVPPAPGTPACLACGEAKYYAVLRDGQEVDLLRTWGAREWTRADGRGRMETQLLDVFLGIARAAGRRG